MMTAEKEAVLRSIRKLADFWHITAQELMAAPGPDPANHPALRAPPPPKYRHPITGDTWDGVGSQPPWLKEALTKQGYTVDELRCPADAPVVPPTGIEPVSSA